MDATVFNSGRATENHAIKWPRLIAVALLLGVCAIAFFSRYCEPEPTKSETIVFISLLFLTLLESFAGKSAGTSHKR